MRSVQSRAATAGITKTFISRLYFRYLVLARRQRVAPAAVSSRCRRRPRSLRYAYPRRRVLHITRARGANRTRSFHIREHPPFVAASCRARQHVVRNPLRAALHPLHPPSPASCRPCRPCRTRAGSPATPFAAINAAAACISMACATLNSWFARAAAIVCGALPPRRPGVQPGPFEAERAETPDRVRHRAEMIGERGIVPAEPSVREEGVHPGAPARRGVDGQGAAAALVASYPFPDASLRASSARRARSRSASARAGAKCCSSAWSLARASEANALADASAAAEMASGSSPRWRTRLDVRGRCAGALVDRVGGGAETRRVRRLRRHHLRGSLVRRLLGEFHRVGRSPSFLSNLRRVPSPPPPPASWRGIEASCAADASRTSCYRRRTRPASERCDRLALTAGSAPVGQRQHAGVRGTRQRQSVVPDGLRRLITQSSTRQHPLYLAPFEPLPSRRERRRRSAPRAPTQRPSPTDSPRLPRRSRGGGVVRRRRPAVGSAREDTPRHERATGTSSSSSETVEPRADRFGFETLRGRGGFQLRRFDFGIVFGIVSGIDFGTDGPLRLRARRRDWDLVRLGTRRARSVANLEKGHHPLRARRVVGDGDGRVPRSAHRSAPSPCQNTTARPALGETSNPGQPTPSVTPSRGRDPPRESTPAAPRTRPRSASPWRRCRRRGNRQGSATRRGIRTRRARGGKPQGIAVLGVEITRGAREEGLASGGWGRQVHEHRARTAFVAVVVVVDVDDARGGRGSGVGGGRARRAVVFSRRREGTSPSGARRDPSLSTLPSRAARAREMIDGRAGSERGDVRAIMIASFPGFWGTPVTRAARSASARATSWVSTRDARRPRSGSQIWWGARRSAPGLCELLEPGACLHYRRALVLGREPVDDLPRSSRVRGARNLPNPPRTLFSGERVGLNMCVGRDPARRRVQKTRGGIRRRTNHLRCLDHHYRVRRFRAGAQQSVRQRVKTRS